MGSTEESGSLVQQRLTNSDFLQPKVALATHLLRAQFGDVVQTVAQALLRQGQMTLAELQQVFELPGQRRLATTGAMSAEEQSRNRAVEAIREKKCREGLMVLLQHNLVLTTPAITTKRRGGDESRNKWNRPIAMMYEIDTDAIIRRLSFPKIIEHIKVLNGLVAAQCVKTLSTVPLLGPWYSFGHDCMCNPCCCRHNM